MMRLRSARDLSCTSSPFTPGMTSGVKPVTDDTKENWSNLSGRVGRLMTKTFSNYEWSVSR